jgi:streptogrisin C
MNRTRVARFAGAALLAFGLATSISVPAMGSPQAGDAAYAAMLQAMQRDLGLSAEGALTRIDQETRAAAAEQALNRQLGSSFAGAWFDASAGKLIVAVTDASRIGQVHAAGAEARLVSRSAAALDAQKSTLDRLEAAAPKSVTGWYVDAATNSVVVSVLNSDPAGVAWAAGQGARTESVSVAPQPLATLIGGMAIHTSGSRCSLGFNARNSAGAAVVITAGHCTNIGSRWTDSAGSLIGTRAFSSFPGDDYGGIQVAAGNTVTGLVRGAGGASVRVTGSTQQAPGSSICRSGSTTGWRCGTIGAHNQTVRYPQGTVTGLTRTSACAQPGDSGGSFISGTQAQGMTSGGSGNCSTGGTTFHQPINEVLSVRGLRLVTG